MPLLLAAWCAAASADIITDWNEVALHQTRQRPCLFRHPGPPTADETAAAVLTRYFGTDELPFTSQSEEFPGLVRSYESVWDAAEESGLSRIYGGIQFMSGNVYGLLAGEAVGAYVAEHPLGRHK